jgi:poly(hydroxyalkanoate) granule-associated protein
MAGMGALARAQKEGPRAFESMIVEGASFIDKRRDEAEATVREALQTVQAAVEDRMLDTKSQAAETWENLEKIFQGRVQKVLHQVGVPTAKEISALTRRVDELNANVLALGKVRRTARKPATRRRKATKRTVAAAA